MMPWDQYMGILGYTGHDDQRLWPQSSRICTSGLDWSSVTSYFDVYFPSVIEYENEDVPKFHLTAEERPWDPSTSEY